MATSKLHQSVGPSKSPNGFQNKVGAPRNPKLVTEEEKPVTLTPSAFLKEMSLTTEQRLASTHSPQWPRVVQLLDMSDTSHQKFSSVDLDQTLFQPFPSEVVFQSYVPCEVYEVPLVLRNNDRVPRLVKVILESSPYFKLISPGDACRKVAPGMPLTFRILFTPQENKDYFHQLTCITEREKFVVPIRAIGARAVLDFPDQLNFSVCPVKHNTQRTLLVRNVGNREAHYHISTQSPFSVDPSVGTLGIGDTMQVTVDFHPLKTGDHSGSLVVHYDTGEDVLTSLYGAAVDVNIRLDRNSLMIAKTYLTLANHRSVVIHNRSEIIAHFQWKAFVSQEEEDQQKLRLCHRLRRQEEDEMDRFIDECVADPSLRERLSVLSRVFQNHRAKVQGDSMLFSDDIFAIEPVEGDVWPNSSAEINVIFKPREARLYQQNVYCDISGRETRLPLRIRGEGEGPRLCFSFDQLDIGKVFVGSAHSYEAILFNKGPIDALFHMVPPTTALGSCFSFIPHEGLVLPGGLQHIHISFCSTILGQFTEEFREHQEGAAVLYSSPAPCGIIQPHSSVEVPVTLQAQVMGEQLMVASVAVFGREGSPLDGKDSRWRVEPSQGVIPPEAEVSVAVIANLDDTKKFQDNVNLFIENSSTYVIPVQAVGIGTTIVTDKPFAPQLNLGPHFSLSPCSYHFKITNKGRRTHQLYWTTEGFAPFRQRDPLPAMGGTKDSSPQGPVFQLWPLRMELMPGRTMEMTLEGFSSTPRVVTERLLCHAIIGSKAGKTQIMQVDVTCEFVAPVLQISTREITFRVEKRPSDVLTAQHKPLHLKNISSLPLSVVLLTEQPFSLCDAEQRPLSADSQVSILSFVVQLQELEVFGLWVSSSLA
ncbi:UNVERIFIED_CONTAM: hypothetical protein H355_003132 [Colinus virginianus]|nr:hypothetical protein H355_003132 [Colinus virginianus]